MKRSTIVFDLDDTLVEFVAPFFDWHNDRYGTALGVEDLATAKYLFEAWGGTVEEAVERMPRFFREVDVLGLEPIPGAVECLSELQKRYELALVTARDPAFSDVTEAWIDKYLPGVFDQVILGIGHSERGERSVTKADVCRQIGAGVLVDDQVDHLTGAAENGIRTLLFGRYPWNRARPVPPNGDRVEDWRQVCLALT